MNSPKFEQLAKGVCGTFHAAKLLGVSVGTVQSLVEKGELQAWKTKGGHRRISLDSIRKYEHQRNVVVPWVPSEDLIRLMVVDNDPVFLTLIDDAVQDMNLSVRCIPMPSAIDALMNIGTLRPHVLLTDLRMPEVDGFDFIIKLRSNPQFDALHIVAVTAMTPDEIDARGGLPRNVVLMYKPLNMRWLHGFLSALWSVTVNGDKRNLRYPSG